MAVKLRLIAEPLSKEYIGLLRCSQVRADQQISVDFDIWVCWGRSLIAFLWSVPNIYL